MQEDRPRVVHWPIYVLPNLQKQFDKVKMNLNRHTTQWYLSKCLQIG